jgi:hypothetical protein
VPAREKAIATPQAARAQAGCRRQTAKAATAPLARLARAAQSQTSCGMTMSDDVDDEVHKVVKLRPESPDGDKGRVYEKTLNYRRYPSKECPHKGPYIVDPKLACIECQDCGALLNPFFVLEKLASSEAYWNMRQRELEKYLAEINKEIEDRARTRCTHCGNMTAIRFKKELPKTWVPSSY